MLESTFFTQFLQTTNIKTVLFIAVLVALFAGLKVLEKKKVKFTIRMLGATFLGLVLGLVIQWVAGFPDAPSDVAWIAEVTSWYGLIGYGFMDLLRMLAVPIVFLSVVKVLMDNTGVGKLATRSALMLLGTTAVAALIAIIVGNAFGLGIGAEAIEGAKEMSEVQSIATTLRGLLPKNPFQAMAETNIVAVVIFAGFIGTAINRLKKKHFEEIEGFVKWIEGAYKIIVSVAMTVMKYMPYAIIALLANTIAGRGVSSIYTVIDFIIALYVSTLIMFVIHLGIIALNGLNPLTYLKNVAQPLILAFTSRSSLGTLPVTIKNLNEQAGVKEGQASFVGSLGANMGMNGCAGIYPALMAVTIANMAGVTMDFSFYAMLIVVIAIGSLGIAGLPGTATMAVSVTLSGMGMGAYFPLAGGILAIDPILDMGRTMLNVNGTMTTAVTVANSLGELDKETFNRKDA